MKNEDKLNTNYVLYYLLFPTRFCIFANESGLLKIKCFLLYIC